MGQLNHYFRSNFRLSIDYVTGYRAWGLLLYGTLPSSLAALGILQIPSLNDEPVLSLPFGIVLAIAPLVAMFLLVRQRLSAWYLMGDMLWVRSLVLAAGILLLSSSVSMSAGLLRGSYTPDDFCWTPEFFWKPIIESLLLGIVALVASSALFITAIKEAGGLPGIPSIQQVSDLNVLRQSLAYLQNDAIWNEPVISAELIANLASAKQVAGKLAYQKSSAAADRAFYGQLGELKEFPEDHP